MRHRADSAFALLMPEVSTGALQTYLDWLSETIAEDGILRQCFAQTA